MERPPRLIRSTFAGLVLAIGLGVLASGCGGPAGSGAGPESEKIPEGFAKAKEAMKERAAAKKGRPGGPGQTARGH